MLCDWLPWNHTFGGNHNFGLTLYNGGTLYIDAGAPTPAGFATTAANLREIATTAYFNVPRGYDLLLQALRGDADLRHRFFGRLQILFYAAAGLRQEVSDGIDRLAVEACGERVPWVTGLGATETAPFALCTGAMAVPVSGRVGVAAPGVELKLEPVGALLEARVRGPNVTPGYWRDPGAHPRRVRRRGLLRDGRRARLRRSGRSRARVHLPGAHRRGLQALDRHVGARRAAARGAARGARRAGAGRRHRRRPSATTCAVLVFPNLAACRRLAGLPAEAPVGDVLDGEAVCAGFAAALSAFSAAQAGSSTRVARALLLAEPPSIDARRDHRQGIDQPEGGAAAPRRVRRRALRRRPTDAFHRRRGKDDRRVTTRPSTIQAGDKIAIDVHVHLEAPADGSAADLAARQYFGDSGAARDAHGLAEYYRSRRMACVVFSVDERLSGRPQLSNDEVADFAAANADVAMAFASIDPHRGADGVAEARRLVSAGRVRGLKLHPPLQEFVPNDRLAYPLYEVFAEARLPVLFHTGHSGIGTGMPGGGGIRLKYGNPMPIDDVAVDFPEMPIIMAHPSFPWQDEAISICLHKPTVYIDLSGWSPKYFSPTLVQYANTLLKHKVLFGSDYPLLTPDRWLADFEKTAIRDEVRPLILRENAIKLFGLQ